ncbi:unnamed protein product [Penicillium salamii]|nr:unnamed protein product [Penicillium salamii]
MATQNTPNRMILVSVPRTASNLLLKVLNIPKQPNVITSPKGGYFFYDAFMTAGKEGRLNKAIGEWTTEEKSEVHKAFQHAVTDLEEYSARARAENKMMFAKEHAFWFLNPGFFSGMTHGAVSDEDLKSFQVTVPESYGLSQTFSQNNSTVLPDEYLRTWQLAFIIRHPALAWPSLYRAMQKMCKAGFLEDDDAKGVSLTNMSMQWTRRLFDWCLEQPDAPVTPLVIDANDVIHNPGAVIKFCERAGMDTGSMQFEWKDNERKSETWTPDRASAHNPAELARQQKAASIMLSSLEGSTGINKEKAPISIDIDAEVVKWRAEFGDDVAELLEKATRDAMPDYEYLKANRVTA